MMTEHVILLSEYILTDVCAMCMCMCVCVCVCVCVTDACIAGHMVPPTPPMQCTSTPVSLSWTHSWKDLMPQYLLMVKLEVERLTLWEMMEVRVVRGSSLVL